MTQAAKDEDVATDTGTAAPADAAAPVDEDHPRHLDESDGAVPATGRRVLVAAGSPPAG